MKEQSITNQELLEEISFLKKKIKRLEQSEKIHKQTEVALRTSEAKFKEMFETVEDLYYELDSKGIIKLLSPSVFRLTGWHETELIGKPATSVYSDPQDRERMLLKLSEKGYVNDYGLLLKRKDGEERQASLSAHLVRDKNGQAIGVRGLLRDMTERKQAEMALQESEEQFRKMFEGSPTGIVMAGADARFIKVNAAFCRMLGYTEQELTSLSYRDITHPDDIAEDTLHLKDLVSGKIPLYQTEKRYLRKDKEVVWGSIVVTIMHDKGDRFLYFLTTVQDITIRKQAEEALNQSLEKLRENLIGTIQAMASMVEIRDPYTAGHEKRVSNLARAIAQELGLPNDVIQDVRMAAVIHDIGKISVPAEILSKPGRLTDIEMSLIQTHSQTGYDILKEVDLPYPIAKIVLQHHERLNGSGYPQGIKIGEILLESQIVSVADVVEAMASHRPYRPALGIDSALEEIEKNKGIFYDVVVVDACVRLFREKGFKLE